ncbi:MAG TPA: helix-turn-helix domain-containing protein [Verrucomicrobiota bacterium]|nr:helix-turn-helix domain-containing protein [Verrucomicrobiota bacterium]HPY31368.1 helix-turn-helix domain-containing protein [Verrucomicrobiota bacterium]HQB17940.1 helix-turn-helix domain-containing protein [Verrucomicrobiota bacterium]
MKIEKPLRQQAQPDGTPPAAKAVKIKQAAVILGICENSVRRLIDREKLRTIRTLRHHLVPVAEIERFLSGK